MIVFCNVKKMYIRLKMGRSGSVVVCLTRDRGVAGSNITGGTVLCH